MRFVVDEVALRYVFLPVLPFSPVSVRCTVLRTHLHLSTTQQGKLGTYGCFEYLGENLTEKHFHVGTRTHTRAAHHNLPFLVITCTTH
jgi:hypothetical protein